MNRIGAVIGFWIIIGILLPAVTSFVLYKYFDSEHGVYVSIGEGYWTESTFEQALKRIWEKKVQRPIEIKSFLWISPFEKHYMVVKGPPRRIYLNGQPAKSLFGKSWCMSNDPILPGLHSVVIRLPRIPSESVPLEFFLTRSLRVSEKIRTESLFLEPQSKGVLFVLLVAKYLAIMSRLNLVLLFVIPAMVAIYRQFDPILRKPGLIFFSLFMVMVFLRFDGLTYQMEDGIHPDERAVEKVASYFRAGDLKPHNYLYTPGFHYMTAGLENLAAWILRRDLPDHFVPRFLSALFSSLSCLLVFTIGNAVLPRLCAFAACVLFGFSFLPIQIAHFGIIEPAMVFFFLLGFRFILNLNPESRIKDYLIAGLVSGAAVGIKQTAAIICVPFFLVYLYLNGWNSYRWDAIKKIFGWGLGAALAYLALSPFTLFDFSNFVRAQIFQFRFLSGETHTTLYFVDDPSGLTKILQYLEEGVGYPMVVAAAAGCFLIWRKSRIAFIAIVPVTVLFYFISTLARAAPYHYPLLLCPFLALLAAVTAYDIANRFRFRQVAMVILVIGLLIPPILRTVKLERILSDIDTRQKFSEWAYANLPLGARVDYEQFGPRLLIPVFRSLMIPLWTRGTWEQYMKIRVPEYVIIDSTTANIFLRKNRQIFPEEHEWFSSLRKKGVKIKEFSGTSFGQYNPHIIVYKIPKEHIELPPK